MRGLILFVKENRALLLFGLLLTFFSGFGQTFLIALYVPAISKTFDLTNTAFGSLYAGATISSAVALTYLGKWIDRVSLKKYSISVFIFLALALSVTAFAVHPIMLFIGLMGMRLGGQGLMTHTSITTMSRHFDHTRGKAISMATLGHPLGEAVFPIVVALVIASLGWQVSLIGSALLLLIVMIPAAILILPKISLQNEKPAQIDKSETKWSQRKVLKSRQFYLIAPSVFLMPLLTTGLFFYQVSLAAFKGWSAEWIAICFVGYAIASSSSMLLSGFLIDRYKAKNLFPFYYFPFLIGLGVLLFFNGKWAAPVYMALMGITVGFGSTIKSALQAELFGIHSLGAVRSLFSTLMVLSSAIGPALFGYLLDSGLNFNHILIGAISAIFIVILQSFRIFNAFTRKRIYIKWKSGSHKLTMLFKNRRYELKTANDF